MNNLLYFMLFKFCQENLIFLRASFYIIWTLHYEWVNQSVDRDYLVIREIRRYVFIDQAPFCVWLVLAIYWLQRSTTFEWFDCVLELSTLPCLIQNISIGSCSVLPFRSHWTRFELFCGLLILWTFCDSTCLARINFYLMNEMWFL